MNDERDGIFGSQGSGIVPYEQKALETERVLKREVGVMPIWLGQRMLDNSDLERFHFELSMGACFGQYRGFEIPDAYEMKGHEPYPALAEVDYDLRKVLGGINGPVAIFIIMTKDVAEFPWVVGMDKGLMDVRRLANKKNTFVYKVMMGGFEFQEDGPEDPTGHYSKRATRAHELGGVLLPYHTDYPTPCSRRLVEFMNRVVGADLPGEEFPNYSEEEVRKIAWHVNKEDFNAFSPREGAIPKYPIENGRPVFAF